jgi:hypothetical protein
MILVGDAGGMVSLEDEDMGGWLDNINIYIREIEGHAVS